MHRDNMRFGLLHYYCLVLRKTSSSYMTDSRCPHLLIRHQSMTHLLGPEVVSCSRCLYPHHGNKTGMMPYRWDMPLGTTGLKTIASCMPAISPLGENSANTLHCYIVLSKRRSTLLGIGIRCPNVISFIISFQETLFNLILF